MSGKGGRGTRTSRRRLLSCKCRSTVAWVISKLGQGRVRAMEDREAGSREEVGSPEADVTVCLHAMLRTRLWAGTVWDQSLSSEGHRHIPTNVLFKDTEQPEGREREQ